MSENSLSLVCKLEIGRVWLVVIVVCLVLAFV